MMAITTADDRQIVIAWVHFGTVPNDSKYWITLVFLQLAFQERFYSTLLPIEIELLFLNLICDSGI